MISIDDFLWFAKHLEVHELHGTASWQTCRAELHPLGLRLRIRRKTLEGKLITCDRILDLEELSDAKAPRPIMERAAAVALAQIAAEADAQRECSV